MTADQHEPATDGAEAMEQLAAIARAAYEGDQTFARARLVIAPATKAAMTVNPPTDPRPWTGLSPAWLTGIPVFLDDAMPVGAWRLLDPDGRELKRGGYPEPTTDHDGHTVAVGPVTVHTGRPALDLGAILARYDDIQHYERSTITWERAVADSACDVPDLLAEIDRLRATTPATVDGADPRAALRVIDDLPDLVRAKLGADHIADVTDAMVDAYCYAVGCDSGDSQGMLLAATWDDFADWLHWDNDGLRRVLAWLADTEETTDGH